MKIAHMSGGGEKRVDRLLNRRRRTKESGLVDPSLWRVSGMGLGGKKRITIVFVRKSSQGEGGLENSFTGGRKD